MWVNSLVRTTISLGWAAPDGFSLGNVEVTSHREEQWHLARPRQMEQRKGFLGRREVKHYHITARIRGIRTLEIWTVSYKGMEKSWLTAAASLWPFEKNTNT